jgi:hypothetical protein
MTDGVNHRVQLTLAGVCEELAAMQGRRDAKDTLALTLVENEPICRKDSLATLANSSRLGRELRRVRGVSL